MMTIDDRGGGGSSEMMTIVDMRILQVKMGTPQARKKNWAKNTELHADRTIGNQNYTRYPKIWIFSVFEMMIFDDRGEGGQS